MSLIHKRIFSGLKDRPKLEKRKVDLQGVNGDSLSVDGCAAITFTIGKEKITHPFYVVSNMNRNIILGRDWLADNGVRVYFDLNCLRVGKSYVSLISDIKVASIVRLMKTERLKPQTAAILSGKIRLQSEITDSKLLKVSAVERGFIAQEPGLMITNALVRTSSKIPVMIVNNTNKTISLRRGSVVATVESVDMAAVNSVKQGSNSNSFDLSELNVPECHKSVVTQLVKANKDIFASKMADLTQTDTVQMRIQTEDHAPIKSKPYRTPMHKQPIVTKAIKEMLDANIIRPSQSSWSFPVVIVDKKDGTKRFCVDFRKLNNITKKNVYPLPVIDNILSMLNKAKYFTSLDLTSGYHQIKLDDRDKEKASFCTFQGLYTFNVMPFGLANAPSVFQELMARVLRGLEHFSTAYLDDILIFSATLEEHLSHLKQVFSRIRLHNLKLKLKKCSFLQTETKYLGFVINEQGVKPDPDKVKAIRTMSAPTTVKEVRSFLGMCSYYRRFIPNFSQISTPLVQLTKKYAKFKWSPECEKSFDFLKDSLTVVPLLAYPDMNKPYILYTDASDVAIGGALCQEVDDDEESMQIPGVNNEKPIYFISHKLSDTQRKWSTIEKEAFAIHFCLQKLDYYLHGAQFVIRTDHKPLKYILESDMQNKTIQLWSLGLAAYNCKVEYIPGSQNTCADLLSRMPLSSVDTEDLVSEYSEPDISDKTLEISALNSNKFQPKKFVNCQIDDVDMPELKDLGFQDFDMTVEQSKDAKISEILDSIGKHEANPKDVRKFLVIEDVLYYISDPDNEPVLRLYIPEHLQALVIEQYHDQNGHMGIDKTYDNIRRKYYWPNLYKHLYKYISTCVTCQRRNLQKVKSPLQDTEIPPYPFAKVSVDLSGPYPTTLSGNKYIVSFMDIFSGWPEAFPVPDKSASTVAHLLLEEIIPRYSCPLALLSDNGGEFVNKILKEVVETQNIHHITTTVYRPQSNAKVERFHRTLHDVLSKKIADNEQTWDLFLNQTLAAIRFNINESSKTSPFYLLYHHDPILPLDTILKPRRKYAGDEPHQLAIQEQHRAFTLVHRNVKRAKKRQARYHDKHSKPVELKVGDPVYYKNLRRANKLQSHWNPYYRVVEQTTPVSFTIRNQLDGKVIKAHAEQLRLAQIDDWEIPKDLYGRPLRKATYVVPPETDEASSSDEDDNAPLARIIKRARQERSDSDEESTIPLAELARRLKARQRRIEDELGPSNSSAEEVISELD